MGVNIYLKNRNLPLILAYHVVQYFLERGGRRLLVITRPGLNTSKLMLPH